MKRLSLSNRLALVFFGVTLVAVGALYLYVAPGLQSRLTGEKLTELAATARDHAKPLGRAVDSSTPPPATGSRSCRSTAPWAAPSSTSRPTRAARRPRRPTGPSPTGR
jgi:hypothetical protein